MKKTEIPDRFRESSNTLLDAIGSTSCILGFIDKRFYSKLRLEAPASLTLDGTIETVERMRRRKLELTCVEDHLALAKR
jgi:hypothetical protein